MLNFIDGIVIIVVVLLISGITAINNYVKELQFCNLQSKQDDSRVTVRRSEGVTQISVNEVCVGDVVQLDTGAKIPAGLVKIDFRKWSLFEINFFADGIIIKCSDLKVDESSLTGESVPVSKNSQEKMFILSGCSVVEGDALFLVTAVGKNSEWGKIMVELDTERPDTPLQVIFHKSGDSCSTWHLKTTNNDDFFWIFGR